MADEQLLDIALRREYSTLNLQVTIYGQLPMYRKSDDILGYTMATETVISRGLLVLRADAAYRLSCIPSRFKGLQVSLTVYCKLGVKFGFLPRPWTAAEYNEVLEDDVVWNCDYHIL